MTDKSIMPFGKWKGKTLANVPAQYLMWLYTENKCYGELKAYIKDNLDALKTELRRDHIRKESQAYFDEYDSGIQFENNDKHRCKKFTTLEACNTCPECIFCKIKPKPSKPNKGRYV